MEASSTTNDLVHSSDTSDISSYDFIKMSDNNYNYKEAILNCGVCMKVIIEQFKTKLLPCLHSLCNNCEINEMIDGKITCNCCKQIFTSNEIVDHFLIQYINEDCKILKCNNCTDNAIAKFKCMECEDFLCVECSQAHKRVKITKYHQLTEIDDVPDVDINVKCLIHKTDDLSWFCVTCDKITCRNCQLENHAGHQYGSFEEQENLYKTQMKKLLDDNKNKIPYIVQVSSLANQRIEEVINSENTMRTELIKNIEQIKQALENRGKYLLNEIEKISQEKRHNYLEIKITAEKIEAMSKQVNFFAEAALATNDCKFAVYNSVKAIRNTLKTIEKLKEQSRPPPVNISQTVQLSLNFPVEEFIWMIRQMGDLIVDRLPQSVPVGVFPNFPQQPAGMINNSCNDFCCYGTSYPSVRPGLRFDRHFPYYEPHVYSNPCFRPTLPVSRFGPQWRAPTQLVNFPYSSTANTNTTVFELNHSQMASNLILSPPEQRKSCPIINRGRKVSQTDHHQIGPRPPPLQYGPQTSPRNITPIISHDLSNARKRRLEHAEDICFDQTLPDIDGNLSSSKLNEKCQLSTNFGREVQQPLPVGHLSPTKSHDFTHIFAKNFLDERETKRDQNATTQHGSRLAKKSIVRAFDKEQNYHR